MPNFKPLTAIFLVSLSYLTLVEGWIVMGLTMIGSGLLFGFSVVVLWQVISFGIVQLIWWMLIRPFVLNKGMPLGIQGLLAGFLVYIYGLLISLLTAAQFGINPFIFWINGLIFDTLHMVSTVLFYPIIYHIFRRFYK
ncbi:TPA: preprotein translocase YidC [Streptococcus suis]|nr:preprotein translocase YidC [Streptococcus suis]